MTSYTEDDMLDAYLDVTDNHVSIRKAAQMHGIPHQTLSDRLQGTHAQKDQVQPGQRLSPAQEQRLVTWILHQERLGYAPTHSQVKACAQSMLDIKGEKQPLGKNWLDGFKRRHSEIHTKIGRRMEAARFNGFTPKAIN